VLGVASPAAAEETVRIAVGRFPDGVVLAADGLKAHALDGAELPAPGGKLALEASKDGIRAGKVLLRSDIVRVRAPGTIALRGHSYHRELEVRFRTFDKKPELLVVHPLDLETYVTGIVSSELPGGWPLEAYKAQAVAARTFAVWQKYRRLDLPYHMESSVLDQVYGGAQREHPLAREAAQATRGMVLTSRRQLAQAYFHASCGDHTESAREGWGTALPYLPGSRCGACSAANRYAWTASISKAEVDKALKPILGEPVSSIEVTEKTKTGRTKTVLLKGSSRSKHITGADLRRLLGYSKLWSTWIDSMAFDGPSLVVKGKGAGHGVGMCQWGARGMALKGKRYDDILAVYYPGARIARLY
jgi:stage II sporulation protein D